jgi:serine/threonine protein kinase
VDIWGVGEVAWDLFHLRLLKGQLFQAGDMNCSPSDAQFLANAIGTLGAPPRDLVLRNPAVSGLYWDKRGMIQFPPFPPRPCILLCSGIWKVKAPIPWHHNLDKLHVEAKDSVGFKKFVRRCLAWRPEDRPTAKELLEDPWLKDRCTVGTMRL